MPTVTNIHSPSTLYYFFFASQFCGALLAGCTSLFSGLTLWQINGVEFGMIRLGQSYQVLWAVIILDAVYMVNRFIIPKSPPIELFPYDSMLRQVAILTGSRIIGKMKQYITVVNSFPTLPRMVVRSFSWDTSRVAMQEWARIPLVMTILTISVVCDFSSLTAATFTNAARNIFGKLDVRPPDNTLITTLALHPMPGNIRDRKALSVSILRKRVSRHLGDLHSAATQTSARWMNGSFCHFSPRVDHYTSLIAGGL